MCSYARPLAAYLPLIRIVVSVRSACPITLLLHRNTQRQVANEEAPQLLTTQAGACLQRAARRAQHLGGPAAPIRAVAHQHAAVSCPPAARRRAFWQEAGLACSRDGARLPARHLAVSTPGSHQQTPGGTHDKCTSDRRVLNPLKQAAIRRAACEAHSIILEGLAGRSVLLQDGDMLP